MNNNTNRNELQEFFSELNQILAFTVDHVNLRVSDDLRNAINESWREIRPVFRTIDLFLIETWQSIEPQLEREGLTGNQLLMKLIGFRNSINKWEETGNLKWFDSIFDWANIILESIVPILPPSGPLKEFKGAMHRTFKDTEESEK